MDYKVWAGELLSELTSMQTDDRYFFPYVVDDSEKFVATVAAALKKAYQDGAAEAVRNFMEISAEMDRRRF
jgi:hypothetical protein